MTSWFVVVLHDVMNPAATCHERERQRAGELVRAALDKARDQGFLAVDLLVFAGNVPACRTYLSVGFVDAGPISPEYSTVRRMSLNLQP